MVAEKRWHTREASGIRLDRDGVWWHDNERVEHPKIIETFNVGLSPTDDGRYKLSVGADWCYVEVEDAAYRVRVLDEGPDGLSVRLSDRTAEALQVDTLALDADGVLVCRVKNGKAKARFCRDAHYALGSLVKEEGGRAWVVSGELRLALPAAVQSALGL
ncbi:MAG: DUF1285 domain-containing protein [Myxococcaceae bacterium]